MSLSIGGQRVEVPNLRTISFLDDSGLRAGAEDRRPRTTRWVRSIIMHTTEGDEPQIVNPGIGPSLRGHYRAARVWREDAETHASAHLTIDCDGTIGCHADLLTEVAFHATSVNEVSIGVELYQTTKLEVWDGQLDAAVVLCDFLTRQFSIQRQFHAPWLGDNNNVRRLASGGEDCVGVFGHRDQDAIRRGRGDPGDAFFFKLAEAGYEAFNFQLGEDKETWHERQVQRMIPADGIPGPQTSAALKYMSGDRLAGRSLLAAPPRARTGLWIERPGD